MPPMKHETRSFEDTGLRYDGNALEYPISADLSRKDWALLYLACVGKNVVEVGSGGSTLMLASVVKSLVSYESDKAWFDLVVRRLEKQGKRCRTEVRLVGETHPSKLSPPAADIYFIDCYAAGRNRWLSWSLRNQLAKEIFVHDSRRESTLVSLESLYRCPDALYIDQVHYHQGNSNMIVVTPRAKPVRYENWNNTERDNRRKHLHRG